jgi:hypothetical protein
MTSTKIEPSRSKKKLLIIAGVCGILSPIVAWSLISLAIFYSPGNLDLTQNWLADLGGMGYASFLNVSRPIVNSPTTEILYLSGLIIAGILAIVFSIGLFNDDGAPSYRLGAVFALLGSGALSAQGIFSEPMGVINLAVTFASALLLSTAALLIGGALIDESRKQVGGRSIAGLSIVLGIITLAGLSLISYLRSVAVIITFLAISVWALVFGVRMLWHASHQMSN